MEIPSIDTAGGAASQTASQSARTKFNEDYTSFLKLLTAQIQNQDPLSPIDSTTFVTQLAQLTQVEQTISSNATLEKISSQLASSEAISGVGLIGRDISLATDKLELRGGSAAFDYRLAESASQVTARIKAEDGTVVRELTGLAGTADERHGVEWDGRDGNGLPVPDADFVVEMEVKTADDKPVAASTYSTTRVEQVMFEGGEPRLLLRNGDKVIAGQILSIR